MRRHSARLLLTAALALLTLPAVRSFAARPDAQRRPDLKALQRAVQQHPQDANRRLDYAQALLRAGRRADAQAQLADVRSRSAKLSPAQAARLKSLETSARAGQAVGRPAPTAVPKAITWLPYEKALDTAKQEHKLVVVDFMAEWCSWCKRMDREVYTDPNVIALARSYVFAKVDGDRQRQLTQGYQVSGYPTTVVMDNEGRELGRIVGYKPAAEFVKEVKAASSNR